MQPHEPHTFFLFHSHAGGAIRVSEESMELQALLPGWSFKRNLAFFFFFFSEMRFCVHRILFILLAHVSPDLHSFHFEQPPSILLRLTASNECPIFKSWLMEWRKEEQRSLSMKFRVLMCQPSAFATIKICVMGNRCTN